MLPARVLEDGIVNAVLTDTDPTDNTPISDILLAGAAKVFGLADPSSPHPSDNLPLHVVPHADVTARADDDGPGTPPLMLTYLPQSLQRRIWYRQVVQRAQLFSFM